MSRRANLLAIVPASCREAVAGVAVVRESGHLVRRQALRAGEGVRDASLCVPYCLQMGVAHAASVNDESYIEIEECAESEGFPVQDSGSGKFVLHAHARIHPQGKKRDCSGHAAYSQKRSSSADVSCEYDEVEKDAKFIAVMPKVVLRHRVWVEQEIDQRHTGLQGFDVEQHRHRAPRLPVHQGGNRECLRQVSNIGEHGRRIQPEVRQCH